MISAFNPGAGLVRLVAEVAPQVERVLVVDDGSTDPGAPAVLGSCAQLGAAVLRHGDNRGVAAALNTGVALACSGQPPADAVLTLDQDSGLGAGYVAALLSAWDRAVAVGLRVGLVAPEQVAGQPSQARRQTAGVTTGRDPVQSGLLVPGDVLHTVGRFDESLVIDGVDDDYALRCLDAGLTVVVARGLTLAHRLGDRHRVTVLGRRLLVRGRPLELTVAAPFRYYYLVRNRIVLVRRHAARHPRWAAGQLVGLLGHLGLVLGLVPGRGERAGRVLHGVRDGLRGRGGPAPPR